jgi:hypothetical protein
MIPKTHPRLWWTPERLARAKAWFARNPFTPSARDEDFTADLAFSCVLTGDRTVARRGVDWALSVDFTTEGTASNQARWSGEGVALVYDWCHDALTEAERETLIDRWNRINESLNAKPWGGPQMPNSNYFWGYLRNTIEWGIATYHENPKAQALLDHAMNVQWSAFSKYAQKELMGGVAQEGSQYGRYMLGYPVVPLSSAGNLGRDLWEETNFFKQALFYMLYVTPPAPTGSRWEVFPFNNDQFFREGGSAESIYLGSFLAAATDRWKDLPIGRYGRYQLDRIKPKVPRFIAASMQSPEPARLDALALDYYASGIQYLYAKTSWGPEAMVVNLQMGDSVGVGHSHLDTGSFQIWRGGQWISRESTAYAGSFVGWSGKGSISPRHSAVHNMVLFNGYGRANAYEVGSAKVTRLESRAHHAYAAVDLTGVYRSTSEHVERDVNPFVKAIVREFVFVRPLEALVILDRVESTGADVTKTFVLHSGPVPRIAGMSAMAEAGKQTMRVDTLVPTTATYRVVAEGGSGQGQNRIEVDTRDAAQSHMLHVVQAHDLGAAELKATAMETASGWQVRLVHPQKGTAVLGFEKGLASAGGSFGYAASGEPVAKPLGAGVQAMTVTNNGPVWHP